jgi:hypothetical protein
MTFDLRAQLLVDLGNWQAGLAKASKQMTGFGKSMKTISNGIKAGFAGVAFLGVAALYDGIIDLTKAAADDKRSMALLEEQMRRTWKGNSQLNKSIDAQIDKMSNLTGIADDDLRPALIKIAGVTKSPAKGMKMLGLAIDIATKTGKGLSAVSQAMSRYLGGNKTALDKLVPGLKESGDRMSFLNKEYLGFAEISGKNDPFGRITVIMDNFKEKLGKAFLPLANNFADWLAGDEAQKALDNIAKQVQDTFSWLSSPEGQKAINDWYQKAKKLVGEVVKIVEGLAEFMAMFNKDKTPDKSQNFGSRGGAMRPGAINPDGSNPNTFNVFAPRTNDPLRQFSAKPSTPAAAGQVIYNIYGVASGADVLKVLKGEASKKGRTVLGLITG